MLLHFSLHREMRSTLQVDVQWKASTEQTQRDTDLRFCTYNSIELSCVPLCCHLVTYHSFPGKKSVPELNDQPTYTYRLEVGPDDVSTCTWESHFNQGKAYYSISLLSFMQKTMQQLVTSNIRSESLGYFPYTYNNLPTNQGSPQKLQCTMWLHIYRKQWKTESYTWTVLDTEGASDSTSCDITKAAKWHGFRDNLAMDRFHAGW